MWLVNQLTASTKRSVLTEWWWFVSHQSGEHTSIVFSASFFPLLNLFFNFPSNNKPILLSFFPLCLFLNINLAVVDLLEYNDYFRVFSIPPPQKKIPTKISLVFLEKLTPWSFECLKLLLVLVSNLPEAYVFPWVCWSWRCYWPGHEEDDWCLSCFVSLGT